MNNSISNRYPFPNELREFIYFRNRLNTGSTLPDLLADETLRVKLKDWIEWHQPFISKSPAMQNMVQISWEQEGCAPYNILSRVQNAYSMISSFCSQVEAGIAPLTYSQIQKNPDEIYEYLDLGILDSQDIIDVVIKTKNNLNWMSKFDVIINLVTSSNKPLFHHPKLLSKADQLIPYLDPEEILAFLMFQDRHGNSALHFFDNLTDVTPLLKHLDSQDVIEAFSVLNNSGQHPLGTLEDLLTAYPLFEFLFSIESEQFFTLMTLEDSNGFSLLDSTSSFVQLVPFLMKELTWSQQKRLFSRQNNGITTLEQGFNFDVCIPYMKKLDRDRIWQIFQIENGTGIPIIHNAGILSAALPILEMFSVKEIFELTSMTNKSGNATPIIKNSHLRVYATNLLEKQDPIQLIQTLQIDLTDFISDLDNYSFVLDLFANIWPQHLSRFLMITDEQGLLLIENKLFFKRVLRFFEKLDEENLIEILSHPSKQTTPLIHSEQLLMHFAPLFQNIDLNKMVRILSIESKAGWKVVHSEKRLIIILRNVSSARYPAIFEIKNKRGKTLLHFSDALNLIPLFKELGITSLVRIFSLLDDNEQPLIHNLEILQEFMPMMENLPDEDFGKICGISNSMGDTLLHKIHVKKRLLSQVNERQIDLASFVNSDGLSAEDVWNYDLNPTWLLDESLDDSQNLCMQHVKDTIKKLVVDMVNTKYNGSDRFLQLAFYAVGLQSNADPDDYEDLTERGFDLMWDINEHVTFLNFYREFQKRVSNEDAIQCLHMTVPKSYRPDLLEWERYFTKQEHLLINETENSLREVLGSSITSSTAFELRNAVLTLYTENDNFSKFDRILQEHQIPKAQSFDVFKIMHKDYLGWQKHLSEFQSLNIPIDEEMSFAKTCAYERQFSYNEHAFNSRQDMLFEILLRFGVIFPVE